MIHFGRRFSISPHIQTQTINWNLKNSFPLENTESRDGAVVRALASYQCAPGSISGLGVICGLSFCSEGFSPGSPVFLPPQKSTFPNSNSNWKQYLDRRATLWIPLKFPFIYLKYQSLEISNQFIKGYFPQSFR